MFSCYTNIYSPEVLAEIDVYEFLDRIQTPDRRTKESIIQARICKMNDDDVGYQEIKRSLPCFTINFSFKKSKSNDNIEAPTGFIYLDVDNSKNIDVSNPLIFAAWKSLSATGYGLLIKVDGLTLENFKSTYEEIGKELGIKADANAGKASQYTIHSYDDKIYMNNESITWSAITIDSPTSLTYKKKKKRYAYVMGEEETIKYDNLQDVDFDGHDYLVYDDKKYQAAKAYIPKKIASGNRNQTLFSFGSQFKALNPTISEDYIYKLMHGINTSCCVPELPENEVNKIIKNINKLQNPEPFKNYPRRVIFSPKTDLSSSEKRKIVNGVTGLIRSRKTLASLVNAVYWWDYPEYGRITQKKLKAVTGRNIKTIEKYYKELQDID